MMFFDQTIFTIILCLICIASIAYLLRIAVKSHDLKYGLINDDIDEINQKALIASYKVDNTYPLARAIAAYLMKKGLLKHDSQAIDAIIQYPISVEIMGKINIVDFTQYLILNHLNLNMIDDEPMDAKHPLHLQPADCSGEMVTLPIMSLKEIAENAKIREEMARDMNNSSAKMARAVFQSLNQEKDKQDDPLKKSS